MARFFGPVVMALIVSVLALNAVPPAAAAQQWAMPNADRIFRVEWEQATTKRGRTVLRGYVHNNQGYHAGNVRLLIESLDASGAVATTGVGYVPGTVGAFDRLYFEVPLTAPAASYRVRVAAWEPVGRGGG